MRYICLRSAGAWRGVELQRRFVTLTVRPRAGMGGRTVLAPQPLTNGLCPGVAPEDLEWRPGGYDLDVQVAAISVSALCCAVLCGAVRGRGRVSTPKHDWTVGTVGTVCAACTSDGSGDYGLLEPSN